MKNPLFYKKTNANSLKIGFAKRKLFIVGALLAIFSTVFIASALNDSARIENIGSITTAFVFGGVIAETKSKHEERAGLVTAMTDIAKKAKAENRDMTDEESRKFDELDTKQEKLNSEIRRLERLHELNSDERDNLLKKAKESNGDQSVELAAETKLKERKAFVKFLAGGMAPLNEDERSIMKSLEVRAQSVGTTTAGGFLVPEGFQAELMKAMLAFGGVREVARILNTQSGNDIPWPNMNDTANKGRLLTENTQVTETALVFGSKTLKAYKYSSDSVLVSSELLNDSAINVEQIVIDALAERLARITNEHFTTGDNSSKPQGVVTAAGAGKTTASETATTYSEIVDLEHSVNSAYRNNAKFMFNDDTLKSIKKLSIGSSDARPLWDPGIFRSGVPATILGYQYVINDDMASMAADAKFMLFGDFSKYVIRDVMGFTLKRLVERYADYDQVGFFAFSRHDGRLVTSDSPIKYMINANT